MSKVTPIIRTGKRVYTIPLNKMDWLNPEKDKIRESMLMNLSTEMYIELQNIIHMP